MKSLLLIMLTSISFNIFGQKYNMTHFNKLTEVEGTPYIIAGVDERNKIENKRLSYLLFINTNDKKTHEVNFGVGGYYLNVEQIKIDELYINSILVSAKTLDWTSKNGIDGEDPTQLFVLSVDGKTKTLLTPSSFYVQKWVVNKQSGTLTVTGFPDLNQNGKLDKSEFSQIEIYDLKTLKLIHKI